MQNSLCDEERLSTIRLWLDKILLSQNINLSTKNGDDADSSYASGSSFSSTSTRHQISPWTFEQNEKTLQSLEFLMNLNEEFDEKTDDDDSILKRNSDKWLLATNNYFENRQNNNNLLSNFQSSLRHLRLDRSSEENLKILIQILTKISSPDDDDDDLLSFSNSDLFLISSTSALFRDEIAVENRLRNSDAEYEFLDEKLRRLLSEKLILDREFERKSNRKERDDVEISEKETDSTFMKKKSQRYSKQLNDLEKELFTNRLFDPKTLSRSILTENQRRNDELRTELEKLKKELDIFKDLPANLDLARLKVEESKSQLNQLKKEVFKRFGT